MKVVIEIDDDLYDEIEMGEEIKVCFTANLIKNGIPLENYIRDITEEIKEEKECAYADFERYKVEYLGQDWEEVFDSLPNDDFRFGMERALEIICKHYKDSEKESAKLMGDEG